MTDKQLKAIGSCPFCGGVAEMYYPFHLMGKPNSPATYNGGVRCKECGCQACSTTPPDQAISAWNRRAAPAAPTEEERLPLDRLADHIGDNWPDKKYSLEEICQRLYAMWPQAFMPAQPAPTEGARDAGVGTAVAWAYECKQPYCDPERWTEFCGRKKPTETERVRIVEPLYAHPDPLLAEAVEALVELRNNIAGKDKACGHRHECICAWKKSADFLAKVQAAKEQAS